MGRCFWVKGGLFEKWRDDRNFQGCGVMNGPEGLIHDFGDQMTYCRGVIFYEG